MSLDRAPFVTSHISLKMWPSDKAKENCDTNLIRIANNNHTIRQLSLTVCVQMKLAVYPCISGCLI